MNNNTPYANLDPHLILSAVESVGLACTGGLSALNSFENRVYQIEMEESAPLIAKFYRPHRWSDAAILEEHQFSLELTEREIPVISPWMNDLGQTLHHFEGYRFALFPRRGGRALELDRTDQLEWMGRFIGRLHAVGASKKFQHRLHLNVQTYGYQPFQYLIENNFIPAELLANFKQTVEMLLDKIKQRFEEVGDVPNIRLHGDMHVGNVLWSDHGPHIVDLDDCLTGPAIQDIWMLTSGSPAQVESQLEYILSGYQEFHDFNYRERKLIEPLRTLRMINYAGWLAKRWEDPAFPLNFPWFNTVHYWQELLTHLKEQLYLLSDNDDEED